MHPKIKIMKLRELEVHELYEPAFRLPTAFATPNPAGSGVLNTFESLVDVTQQTQRGRLRQRQEYRRDYEKEINLGNYAKLKEKISILIRNKKTKEIEILLSDNERPFLRKIAEQPLPDNIHTDSVTERQGQEGIVMGFYSACTNLEMLALEGDLSLLLQPNVSNANEIKRLTLNALKHIRLLPPDEGICYESEGIDFSGLDLDKACFEGAQLGCSDFSKAKITGANFSNADLRHCHFVTAPLSDLGDSDVVPFDDADQIITGAEEPDTKLDTCVYPGASLPAGFMPYWDQEMQLKLAALLQKLQKYAREHIQTREEKFKKINMLCHSALKPLQADAGISNGEKRKLIKDLNEAMPTLSTHRDLKYLVAEVLSFIAMGGIGYLIAASVGKVKTGRFGIFTMPTSERLARRLQKELSSPPPRRKPRRISS